MRSDGKFTQRWLNSVNPEDDEMMEESQLNWQVRETLLAWSRLSWGGRHDDFDNEICAVTTARVGYVLFPSYQTRFPVGFGLTGQFQDSVHHCLAVSEIVCRIA